jgi:hypothetical protein
MAALQRSAADVAKSELVMAIVEIKIDAVEPLADGQAFGEAGSYQRIRGNAKGELDRSRGRRPCRRSLAVACRCRRLYQSRKRTRSVLS